MLENTPDTLTVKDLQRVLHIGKNMSLRLINENIIEAHKIGGKWAATYYGAWAKTYVCDNTCRAGSFIAKD